jgi:hypothetical protein
MVFSTSFVGHTLLTQGVIGYAGLAQQSSMTTQLAVAPEIVPVQPNET